MKTIVIISVHGETKNCFSSNDFNGYKEFNSEKEAISFIKENNFIKKESYTDAELKLTLIYLSTYEYNKDRQKAEQFFINGFSPDAQIYWDKQEAIKNVKRKAEGFIHCKKYEEMKAEDYKGVLKNALTDITVRYISSSVVAGYLGHSFRQLEHDKIIEEIFNNVTVTVDEIEVNKWDILSTWLTSSDSRHWMDSVEYTIIEEFEEKFNSYIADVVNLGYIYNLDEHTGTYKSTIELIKAYEGRIVVKVA